MGFVEEFMGPVMFDLILHLIKTEDRWSFSFISLGLFSMLAVVEIARIR